jgi:hypothetical protein
MAIPTNLSLASAANSYDYAASVTLSDTTDIPLTRALWIMHTTAFAVSVVMSNGDVVVFEAHAQASAGANILLPIRVTRVRSTGSTSGIKVVALY